MLTRYAYLTWLTKWKYNKIYACLYQHCIFSYFKLNHILTTITTVTYPTRSLCHYGNFWNVVCASRLGGSKEFLNISAELRWKFNKINTNNSSLNSYIIFFLVFFFCLLGKHIFEMRFSNKLKMWSYTNWFGISFHIFMTCSRIS